jgi:integrase
MTLDYGTYYYRPRGTRKRTNLGQDFGAAMTDYGKLRGTPRKCVTLADVIERYSTDVLPLKKSAATRKDGAAALARLVKVFGHLEPDEITAPQCYEYMDRRVTKEIVRASGKVIPSRPAPVAARHEITLLGHVLAKAIRWGAGKSNVVRTLERMPKSKRDRYVEDAEVDALKAIASERMRLAIDLARNIGQRRGDLLKIRREDISDAGIVIRQGKRGKGVLVQMTDALDATVKALWALAPQIPRDYLIRTEHGTPYTARGFSAMWQRLIGKFVTQGGKRFTFHDLRAKAGSDKETIEEAQALLGHGSPETTKRVYKRNLTKARPVK